MKKDEMNMIGLDRYRDGGTIIVKMSYRNYFINHKFNTLNQGRVFLSYDNIGDENNIVSSELEILILNTVISYLSQRLFNPNKTV